MKQYILIGLCALISFIQIFSSAQSNVEIYGGITMRPIGSNRIQYTAPDGAFVEFNYATGRYWGQDHNRMALHDPQPVFNKYEKWFLLAKEKAKPYLMQ